MSRPNEIVLATIEVVKRISNIAGVVVSLLLFYRKEFVGMIIEAVIKDKKTGKTIAYRVSKANITRVLELADILKLTTKYEIKNAVLVDNKYIRAKKGKLPVEYGVQTVKKFKDYSKYEKQHIGTLGGVNLKYVLKYGKHKLLVKFPKTNGLVTVYDHITEYIGCKIAKDLGYPVQEVNLGYYNGDECVVIKMFKTIPTTYDGLGESSLEGKEKEYNLDWLISLEMGHKFNITQKHYKTWVYKVFILDMFLGNFDRHENNWGFIRKLDGNYTIAPLYDFGASMYPKFITSKNKPQTDNEIKDFIWYGTKSAILFKGKKRSYFNLIQVLIKDNDFRVLFKHFTSLVREIYVKGSITKHLKDVVEYNNSYAAHMLFLQKVVEIKIKGMEAIIRDWDNQ